MKLADYLADKDLAARDFATLIGVKGRATVHRYCNGTRVPDRKTMARIVAATDGQVQPNDFFDTGGESPPLAPEDAPPSAHAAAIAGGG